MKRYVQLFSKVLLILCFILLYSCNSVSEKKPLMDQYYEEARLYLEEKKYRQLRKVAEQILLNNKTEYQAAYYKALAMVKLKYYKGIVFYLNFIKTYNEIIPDEYKKRWLDLVKEVTYDKKDVSLDSILAHSIPIEPSDGEPVLSNGKVALTDNYIFYLNKSGDFYKIDSVTLDTKKINYYRTNDFIISGTFAIFNDSINLLKYEYSLKKYDLLMSFETVNLEFTKHNKRGFSSIIENIIDGTVNLFFYNITKDQIIKLPEDCVGQSEHLRYFVRKNNDGFKIFDIDGEENFGVPYHYLGFLSDNSIFTYNQSFIYTHVLNSKEYDMLFYYPDVSGIKDCFSREGKIIVVFDEGFLVTNEDFTHLNYFKGRILQESGKGLIYISEDNKVCYIEYGNSYFINRLNCAPEDVVITEQTSPYFSCIENNILKMYDLRKISMKKK